MKKGMNPLETIFTVIILLVVTTLVITLFIKTIQNMKDKQKKIIVDIENAEGYRESIDICDRLCMEYKASRGNPNKMIEYCTKRVEIDINGDGIKDPGSPQVNDIYGNGVMLAPIKYVVCEKNIYCPMITDCDYLTMKKCKELVCNYYVESQENVEAASRIIRMLYNPGECDLDKLSNETGTINWYKHYRFDTCSEDIEITTKSECESNDGLCMTSDDCRISQGESIGRCDDDFDNPICCKI